MGMADKDCPGILTFFDGQTAGIPTIAEVVPGMIVRTDQNADVFVFFTFYFGLKHGFMFAGGLGQGAWSRECAYR